MHNRKNCILHVQVPRVEKIFSSLNPQNIEWFPKMFKLMSQSAKTEFSIGNIYICKTLNELGNMRLCHILYENLGAGRRQQYLTDKLEYAIFSPISNPTGEFFLNILQENWFIRHSQCLDFALFISRFAT